MLYKIKNKNYQIVIVHKENNRKNKNLNKIIQLINLICNKKIKIMLNNRLVQQSKRK
jgi:UDP-N-acetylglucosamine 2-epimerase